MSSQIRVQVPRIEARSMRTVRRPFGLTPAEIVAVALVFIFFLAALVYYFTWLEPLKEELRQAESRLALQRGILIDASKPPDDGQGPKNTAKEALGSLEAFRNEHLKPLGPGRKALYDEINALAKKNGLQLMSGISTKFEGGGLGPAQKASKRKNAQEALNVFPKIEAEFAVAGQYANLRSFISELERTKQFLIIDSIELTQVETVEGRRGSRAPVASGVALSIKLTSYFQP